MRKEASLRKVRQMISSLSLSMEDTMARVNVGNNCFERHIENVLALWGNIMATTSTKSPILCWSITCFFCCLFWAYPVFHYFFPPPSLITMATSVCLMSAREASCLAAAC